MGYLNELVEKFYETHKIEAELGASNQPGTVTFQQLLHTNINVDAFVTNKFHALEVMQYLKLLYKKDVSAVKF
jgi:hypothetical protein